VRPVEYVGQLADQGGATIDPLLDPLHAILQSLTTKGRLRYRPLLVTEPVKDCTDAPGP